MATLSNLPPQAPACHGRQAVGKLDQPPIVLVGNPNVGKSALFGALTGRYVEVSNFPGTTVELATGQVETQVAIDDAVGGEILVEPA